MSATQIILRRDTRANWASVNPILELVEIGVITGETPVVIKLGDGSTTWNNLPEIVLGNQTVNLTDINVAVPATTPTQKVTYFTAIPGTYSNFIDDSLNAITVSPGEVCILTGHGSTTWEKLVITNILSYLGIYNLNANYTSKVTARTAVPSILHIPGVIVTYRLNGDVFTEQFIGSSWSTADSAWKEFGASQTLQWQTIS